MQLIRPSTFRAPRLGMEKHAVGQSNARLSVGRGVARRNGEAGIGNDTAVVFYGEPVQFGIYAWWAFKYAGHSNVKVLNGARQRWQAEGRSLTTKLPVPPAPVVYRPTKRNEPMRVGRDEVLAALGKADQVILDGRSTEEYKGERVGAPGHPDTGALRYGRIPGARISCSKSCSTRQELQTAT